MLKLQWPPCLLSWTVTRGPTVHRVKGCSGKGLGVRSRFCKEGSGDKGEDQDFGNRGSVGASKMTNIIVAQF